ncbi:MAG: hypothetical protein QME85_03685 [Candidatus Saccharicenans sp.]|nr:hypothetical protein [Candidatus Saccharicenans sp.]
MADREYRISWTATEVSGDVNVNLIHRRAGHEQTFPTATVPASRRQIIYRVPCRLTVSPYEFVIEVATPDNRVKGYQNITVYTQSVDLVCEISEVAQVNWVEDYFVDKYGGSYQEFKVGVMNQGMDRPVWAELNLRIIKMPENVVVHTEQWAMANIQPRSWYYRLKPFQVDLRAKTIRALNYPGSDPRVREGHFVFEASVSSADELEYLRYNNTTTRNKRIR